MNNLSLNLFSNFINKLISLDIETKSKIVCLNNKNIIIEISNLNIEIWCLVNNTQIKLSLMPCDKEASVKLIGTSSDYIKALLSKSKNPMDKFKGINISGELETAQILQNIISNLDIDWEEHLSKYTGDIAANEIGKFVEKTKNKIKNVSAEILGMTEEYIKYEKRLVANKTNITKFITEVDELRDNVERLEARINFLTKG